MAGAVLAVLTFSKQQFQQFRAQRHYGFYEALHKDLRDFMARKLPDIPPDRADARIYQAFQICRDNGFDTEKQITRLSYILVTFPSDFAQKESYAWLAALIQAKVSPDIRLDRISACIKSGAAKHG